ncbi:glycosyltransferase family 39 protein [Romeria aff. gracilis LEGE 07310]|uniref:Glycosyltransferase family 39 protein n=1 Tax=Vasconcelosia minhoensis LEGE 07310 TaxID=915328 RepID=A0A8J7DPN8_9CYAN|nr:glycosyltransferase family 39 protein [Romeria gracilis]MBE9080015.1 glycosyltransferase family 39 protein [Romeria aff. gracilis LEGE 07310]
MRYSAGLKEFKKFKGFKGFIVIVLLLGICFRLVGLDSKAYWHDEVYTTLRAVGYTRAEFDQEVFQNQVLTVPDLQKYQQLKPGSSVVDTIDSLALEDPQHPPLYFILARFWLEAFGNSVLASRVLPALLSLLSLPLIYLLAMELFAAPGVALLATALLAFSPLDILFAQIARQYGLLAAVGMGSSWLLLRSLRQPGRLNWGLYALSVAAGFYTHVLFAINLFAHAAYVLILEQFEPVEPPVDKPAGPLSERTVAPPRSRRFRLLAQFAIAVAAALILYGPWLAVLLGNYQRAFAATSWTSANVPLPFMLKQWMLHFTAPFVDLHFGFDNAWTFILRVSFVLLIGLGLYWVYRSTPPWTWLFVFSSIGLPFLALALPDLILGGMRSAIARYLIPCYAGVQLAVAYFLAISLTHRRAIGQWILAFVFTSSIISISASATSNTWWHLETSYTNPAVLEVLNARPSPLVVSDRGEGDTNPGDLLALSYGLKDSVRLFGVGEPADLEALESESDLYVFRPSAPLRAALEEQGWQLQEVVWFGTLWQASRA